MNRQDFLEMKKLGNNVENLVKQNENLFSSISIVGDGALKGEVLFFDESRSLLFLNDDGLFLKITVREYHHNRLSPRANQFIKIDRHGYHESKANPGRKWFKISVRWFGNNYYDECA